MISDGLLQATQDVVSRVPQTTGAEFEAAVAAARDAFPAWRRTPVSVRQRVMLRLQHLIREHTVRTTDGPTRNCKSVHVYGRLLLMPCTVA
jgi:acyl-CoA reductase-like NAD-dependent aldehyde dehydrogenase